MSSNRGYSNLKTGCGVHVAKVVCPYHPDGELVEDHSAGDIICTECGLVVVDRVIDVSNEWRTCISDDGSTDRSRVGTAENLSGTNSSLSTTIGAGSGRASFDSNGRPLYYNRHANSGDRTLSKVFSNIKDLSSRFHLPQTIVESATLIFRKVYDANLTKGHGSMSFAAACMYVACRKENVPTTFRELSGMSCVSVREMARAYKIIRQNLEISVDLVSIDEFVTRFCSGLDLPMAVQLVAINIAQRARELNLVAGRSPVSIAAASVFMAAQVKQDKRSMKEISDVSGAADNTIRLSYRLLLPRANDLFPTDFQFEVPLSELIKL